MSDAVTIDSASFEDTGLIPDVPPKEDVKTSKTIADETDRINRERVKDVVRTQMGEKADEPKPVGTMTKDCPQLVFRLAAKVIGCDKFALDDAEAQVMATNLNILIPLSGKLAAVVIILMITLNKVYICFDQIKAKFGHRKDEILPAEKPPDLPEPLS